MTTETQPLPTIDVMTHDLRGLWQQTTRGIWGKGRSSHETVARHQGAEPYKVAEFRHANDAAFCDAAHAFIPALLDELERRTPAPVGVEPLTLWIDEVRQYLVAAADSSMSRNNSEQLASELLDQMPLAMGIPAGGLR